MIFSKRTIGGQFDWLDDMSEGQYEAVLERVFAAIDALLVVLNKEGRVVWFNKKFADLSGYSLSESKGKYFWDVFASPDEASMYKDSFDNLGPGVSIANKEGNLLGKDGSKHLISWADTSMTDQSGGISYVIQTGVDVETVKEKPGATGEVASLSRGTEALYNVLDDVKESERIAKTERDRLQAIVSSMGESLVLIDKDFKIVLLNNACSTLLGVSIDSTIGKDIRKVIRIFSGAREIPDEEYPLNVVINKGEIASASLESNYYYQLASGKKVPVAFVSTPFTGDEGVSGAVLVFRDITGEKELDEAKSGFISIASHQLRTPLTSMKWFSEMLIDGDAGAITEDQKHFVERIYQSTNRMVELVNLLLQLARVEAGRLKVEPKPINLEDLTKAVDATLKADLDRKSQKFEIKTEPSPFPSIPLDQDIVWQVIQNLSTNAMRYSPEGKTIFIDISIKDKFVQYSVRDEGIGIPEDQRGRIFEKFFRADNALKFVPEGAGLGLSLVKNLVEGWGGKIWFETEMNKGTTFFFTLPVEGMAAKEGEVKLSV